MRCQLLYVINILFGNIDEGVKPIAKLDIIKNG